MEQIIEVLIFILLYFFILVVLFIIIKGILKWVEPNIDQKRINNLFSVFVFVFFLVNFFITYLWGIRIDIYDLVEIIQNYFFGKVPE